MFLIRSQGCTAKITKKARVLRSPRSRKIIALGFASAIARLVPTVTPSALSKVPPVDYAYLGGFLSVPMFLVRSLCSLS